ncbi:universal stress protein [Thalassococcus sp. S3]|uniref:universal stress protein n=1 Tax=Thalassococcus sp. S3 TaxID=2017482 RepID=UPI0010245D71|nr:universal stress protein [Thalassococcus sp. S3]QBF31366.1 hypothetical protein CFI11_09055 [Thalassococcus sp. S3]
MPDTPHPILIASDMSHRSDRAMERAFALGRDRGAEVVVLSVLDDAMPADLLDTLQSRAVSALERYAGSLGNEVNYSIRTELGDPTADILRAVEELDPQLLVMGMHRPRPFLDALRETTMQRIVRRTSCPVLLVADRCDHGYDKILAACDFSPAATSAIAVAHDLAPKATIRPVHALHVPYGGMLAKAPGARQDLEKPFRREAQQNDASWRMHNDLDHLEATEIIDGPAYSTIRTLADRDQIDLVCVGAHGRVGAAPAILGSLASDLMRDPPCDLLIARPAH